MLCVLAAAVAELGREELSRPLDVITSSPASDCVESDSVYETYPSPASLTSTVSASSAPAALVESRLRVGVVPMTPAGT